MKILPTINWVAASLAVTALTCAFGSTARAQITINELVEDEQDFETTDITPDTREFVELYNPSGSAVDISGWTLSVTVFEGGATTMDTLPAGSMVPAGGYFVIGGAPVPNVNYTPAGGLDLWNNGKTIYELRNPNLTGSTLVDAVAVETFRGNELLNLTQEQIDQVSAGETAGSATTKGGWWGQMESLNPHPSDTTFPNLPLSLGRYLDGRDNNVNGRDFGYIPATPGASNNSPIVASHTVPNVNSLAVGAVLRDDYFASFKLPRVIAPGTVDTYNPNVISASPQGGNAIIAWDETGGGNSVHSDNYVNSFKIWAFIDPRAFNNTTADSTQSEATVYGIGTTDPLFATPNSADLLTGQPGTGGNITSSANGSTGLGWLIQRRTSNTAGTQSSAAVLQLIDFNDGGDGVLADAPDWEVIQAIDLTGQNAGWHTLSLDYDPATGDVSAAYDAQTFDFDTVTNLVGNFYIGYRENLPSTGAPIARPPTYDNFVAANNANFDTSAGSAMVDGRDFLIWQRNTGGAGTQATGDANGNNLVNDADFAIWKNQFGTTPAGVNAAAVPEPVGGLLLGFSALGLLMARRSR